MSINKNRLVKLSIDELQQWSDNPRTIINSAWNEIKNSLIATGFNDVFEVTQPPNSTYYIPRKGGNTTLAIMKELHSDGLSGFDLIDCRVSPWTNELDLLVQHGVENHARGNMEFVDDANFINKTAQRALEVDSLENISVRQIVKTLKKMGLLYSHAKVTASIYFCHNIQPYMYAISSTFNNVGFSMADTNYLSKLSAQYLFVEEYLSVNFSSKLKPFSQILTEIDTQITEYSHSNLLSMMCNELVKWTGFKRSQIKVALEQASVQVKYNFDVDYDGESFNAPSKNSRQIDEDKITNITKPMNSLNSNGYLQNEGEFEKVDNSMVESLHSEYKDNTHVIELAKNLSTKYDLQGCFYEIETAVGFYLEIPNEPIELVMKSRVWWSLLLLSFIHEEKNWALLPNDSLLREVLCNNQILSITGTVGKPLSSTHVLIALIEIVELDEIYQAVHKIKTNLRRCAA